MAVAIQELEATATRTLESALSDSEVFCWHAAGYVVYRREFLSADGAQAYTVVHYELEDGRRLWSETVMGAADVLSIVSARQGECSPFPAVYEDRSAWGYRVEWTAKNWPRHRHQ